MHFFRYPKLLDLPISLSILIHLKPLLIQNKNRDGYIFYQRCYTNNPDTENWHMMSDSCKEGAGYIGYCAVDVIRLFRNTPAIHYCGDVSELLEESLRNCPKKHTAIPIHCISRMENYAKNGETSIEQDRKLVVDYEENPESFKNNVLLGVHYYQLGEMENYITHLSQAVRVHTDANVLYRLGMAYLKTEQYRQAVELFQQAMQKKRRWAEPNYGLAEAYFGLSKYNESIAALRMFLQLNPQTLKGINLLGHVYYVQGMYGLAEKLFREALNRYPVYSKAQRNIVRTLHKKGDVEGVAVEGKRLMKLDPSAKEWVDSLLERT